MRVRVITWNMGDNKRSEYEWMAEVSKSWALTSVEGACDAPLSKHCFDVLAITVQEDFKGRKFGRFPEAVAAFLGNEFESHSSIVDGPPDLLNRPFSVKQYVYINRQYAAERGIKFEHAGLCLQKKAGMCSKGTAGVAMNIPNHGQIIFMGSHFPVKVDQLNMGYEKRVGAIQNSLSDVFAKLADPKVDSVAIWAGDMNFRRNTPADSDDAVPDQLNYAMTQGVFSVNGKSFAEQPLEFPPTCKLHSCKKNDCPVCRDATDDKVIEQCYDDHRTPSHCDRVLFFTSAVTPKGVTVLPKLYKAWANSDSVKTSDHNLVWADFEITI